MSTICAVAAAAAGRLSKLTRSSLFYPFALLLFSWRVFKIVHFFFAAAEIFGDRRWLARLWPITYINGKWAEKECGRSAGLARESGRSWQWWGTLWTPIRQVPGQVGTCRTTSNLNLARLGLNWLTGHPVTANRPVSGPSSSPWCRCPDAQTSSL